MKRVLLFGATGSVGLQTIHLLSQFKEEFKLLGVSAKSQLAKLIEIGEKLKPPFIALPDEGTAKFVQERLTYRPTILLGDQGLVELAQLPEADIVVVAISGIKALLPAYHALLAGKRVALANKECLVGAGFLIKEAQAKGSAELMPVDSEHSALFQLLRKEKMSLVERVYLTASGGPFWDWEVDELERVTPELALRHPTWQMGPKITIDSATLMNKGFEVIEASILFDLPLEKIEVLIHPQSFVHSLVEFVDGSIFAHVSKPDMRLSIAYALFYPERSDLHDLRLSFKESLILSFQPPDWQKFPCLALAYQAGRLGHPYPLILEASDEVVVPAFLEGRIKFTQIPLILEKTLKEFNIKRIPSSVEEILAFHEEVRNFTEELLNGIC